MSNRITFTDLEIKEIVYQYTVLKLSGTQIGKFFNMSKTPIIKILRENKILRKNNSSGKKFYLSENVINEIKRLYLDEYKTANEIAKILGYTGSFIDKFLSKTTYRRNKSKSISLRQTGKKRSLEFIEKFTEIQRNYAKSGNRKQTGGVCKSFIIKNLNCVGTYEKFYIEKLVSENKELPKKGDSVKTPFGVYYPDFDYGKMYIEIKSDYTYQILLGKKENRWSNKIDTNQYEKIKWVNNNIKPVEIIVVDKKNNKLIKKEIAWALEVMV